MLSLLVVLIISGGLSACGEDDENPVDVEGSKSTVEEANDALEEKLYKLIVSEMKDVDQPQDLDFSEVNSLFKEALVQNPNNQDANFGAALTEILMMTSNKKVSDAFEKWDSYLQHNGFFSHSFHAISPIGIPTDLKTNQAALKSPVVMTNVLLQMTTSAQTPQMSEVQDILKNEALPVVNYAIAHLAKLSSNYTFTVTPRMQGDVDEDELEIDMTEVYAMLSALNILKSSLHIAVAYNLDMPTYDVQGMINVLKQDSQFMTLKDKGQMSSAKSAMISGADYLDKAISFLEAETDAQSNDIIKLDKINDEALTYLKDYLADLKSSLSGNAVTVAFGKNSEGEIKNVNIDLASFFDNPIQDFKDLLPSYSVSMTKGKNYSGNRVSGSKQVSALITGNGNYKYYSSYYYKDFIRNDNGWSYHSGESIPTFDNEFENLKTELLQNDLASLYISLYWNGTPNGQETVSATINYDYELYVTYDIPMITWDADSFSGWNLPNPTFNGLLPDMTDAELKDLFNINEKDWEKSIAVDFHRVELKSMPAANAMAFHK